jgi:hypothetical protein
MEASIKQLTERLIKAFNPEKIFLFGSYAWGTATAILSQPFESLSNAA